MAQAINPDRDSCTYCGNTIRFRDERGVTTLWFAHHCEAKARAHEDMLTAYQERIAQR